MRVSAGVIAAVAMLVGVGAARGGEDIGLRVQGGAITTWAVQHPATFHAPERVFVGDLDLLGGVVTGEEPGFVIEAASPLTSWQLGFNIRRAARVWDPGAQHFNQVSPLSITIERTLLGAVTTPAADPPAPLTGLSFLVPSSGTDFHYDFILNGSAEGLYLLELEKWTQAPGIASSLPFWIVLNYDVPHAQEEAAVAWVHQHLVPAPGALPLLGVGALAGWRRRR
jgi:uncharacterized protein (TIGR03382 family)